VRGWGRGRGREERGWGRVFEEEVESEGVDDD
jgi:hypothetical protein